MDGTAATAGELAAGSVAHDARQDEHHADNPGQVGEVLDARVAGMVALATGDDVDDHVGDPGQHHDRQSEKDQGG
jgi:hypothetical protein